MKRKKRKKRDRRNRSNRQKPQQHPILQAFLTSLLMGASSSAYAQLPTGADVVAGQAAISQSSQMLNVDAATSRAIVNWDSFNVGAGNVANFNLPSANSAILNRVTSANMPSNIAGALNSNGHVYLVNPSGIVVSSSGMVNTNGFTASTLDVTNQNFMSGGALKFAGNNSAGSVVNNGVINTGDGGAHLIANEITNFGSITSIGGNITLSGGGSVTLDNGVTYVQPTMETLASGISPTAGLIQNSGTIRATGAASVGGEVYLVNPNGNILHDGTIAAESLADASGYDSSQPDALARDLQTAGGHVQLEADEITLAAGSTIDASGTNGGGKVLVGGDWQGSGDMNQATTVTMEAGATIIASATESGDGGTIVLWSDILNSESITRAFGTLIATAGGLLGDGGQIETSGATVETDGIAVNAGAANGNGGLWLIDPYDYTIDASAATNIVNALNTGTSVEVATTANNTSFGSSGSNADNGDITVASDIITGPMTGDATLTLKAARHIVVNAANGIDATQNGNTAKLNVKLWADTDSSGDGISIVSSPTIATNGGSLTFGNGDTATIGGLTTQVGGDLYVNGLTAQLFDTDGGDLTVNGETILANTNGVTFDSGGGDILFAGVLNSGNQYTYLDGLDGQANSWDWARTDAKNGTAGGAALGDSYLVTITSRLENAVAGIAAGYRGAWLGMYRDTSTPRDWVWADGPEAGQHFFTEIDAGGGTAEPGWYSNFGPNEPNGGPDAGGENVGQFFGTAGQWNDLGAATTFSGTQDTQYSVLGYVRETNLTPTALTVDAGAGSVTINGGVGGSKALSSFNVTSSAITINGDSLITTGAQTFNTAVNVTSTGNLTVGGTTLTVSGASEDFLLKATGNVAVNADTQVVTNGGDITLWSDSDNSGQGYISLDADAKLDSRTLADRNATTHTTGGGDITLGGGADDGNGAPAGYAVGASGDANRGGVNFGDQLATANNDTQIYSGGGDVDVRGKSSHSMMGFSWFDGGTINSGDTGKINLEGVNTNTGHAVEFGAWNNGGTTNLQSSAGAGAISITGTASSGTGQGIQATNLVAQATGSGGSISLNGSSVGGTGILGTMDLLSASGSITLDGGTTGISMAGSTLGKKAGTNVMASSADITLIADRLSGDVLTIDTAGHFTFHPYGSRWSNVGFQLEYNGTISSDTFTGAAGDTSWLKINNYSTLGGLTIGKEGNTSHIRTYNPITINGDVNLIGNIITVSQDINVSSAIGAGILLKASGDVIVATNSDLITNAGDVTVWSDTDASGQGGINLRNGSSIDTRTAADRTAGTHTTGGGSITLAGGLDDAGVASGIESGASADGTPDGFAVNMTDTGAGVLFGTFATTGQDSDIDVFSGGGDIIVNARSTQNDSAFSLAMQAFQGLTMDGGQTGDITLHGESDSASSAAVGMDIATYRREEVLAETTIQTVDGNISLHGKARNGTGGNIGIAFDSSTASVGRIQATGTGSITLEGDAVGNGATSLRLSSLDVLSNSGDIELLGTNGTISLNTVSDRGVFLGARTGTDVTASTSDILIRTDALTIQDGLGIDTTGSLVVEPTSNSFSSTLNWADPLIATNNTLGGLTLGKVGNSTTIQLGNTITTAGEQNYYGPVQLSSNTLLSTTNSDITFNGTVNSDGTARSLTVNPGTANASFGGIVGGSAALSALTVNGTANVNADITSNGTQNWTDTITIGGSGARTFNAGTLTTQTIVGGSNDLELITDDLNLGGNVASTGSLTIAPKTAGTDIGVGNISGTFSFDNTDFSRLQDGFLSITIGNSAASDLVVGGITALVDDLTLQAGSSFDLFVNDSLSWSSDDALTLAAGQDIFVNSHINVTGSAAALNLYYGGTDGSSAPTSSTHYYIDVANRRHIRFAETTAGLKIGNESFTLVDSVAALQGMAVGGRYALADDLSLAGTTYTDAFYTSNFAGKLDGLGNEVDGLTIRANAGGNFGLFGQLDGASVRHLGVTNIDLLGQSTSNADANDLRIGGIVGNASGSGTNLLDGVWSTGVIATKQGSQQDVFYAGGLVGGHDSGTLDILRSFSTVNVSSQGSHSGKMALGGLLGDSGDFNGVSGIGGSAQNLLIDRSYATGSIVEGTYDGYYGSGGLVGVVFGDSATLTDSFSRSNVVGGISSGGIAGFSASGTTKTYQRLYTTLDRFGNGTSPTQSYKSDTLDAATSNGTVLPSGWSSDVWTAGEFPTLKAVGVPASLLYVKVVNGTGIFGDLAAPTYQIVDADGNTVSFGTGDYSNLDGVTGTGRYTLGQFTNVGTYNSVSYLSGLGLTGDDANLYALNPFSTAGSFTITPRSITASLSNTGVTKIYDGNANAPSGFTPTYTFGNLASGDAATINFSSLLFNSQDVTAADTLTMSGMTLGGIAGSNGSLLSDYSLTTTNSSLAATITAKPIFIGNISALNKIYDGGTSVTLDTSSVSFTGVVSGDDLTFGSVSGAFADKNVGNGKTVNLTGVFGGTDASNYSSSGNSTTTANITQKSIAASGITAGSRVYEGSTAVAVDLSGVAFTGIVSGDTVNAADTTGAFANKNVGNGKTVTLSGTTYAGTDVGNYSITDQATTTANITPKAITVSGLSASDRIYDGTTTTTVDHSGVTFGGIVSGDSLTASSTAGTFGNKNVGSNKAVTLSGTTYGGTDVGNYTFTDQTASTADISQKAITVSGITADDKVYDRLTTSTVNLSGVAFSGIVSGDDLSASDATGTFGNKNVGSNKTVTLSGMTYGGTDVGNYSFTDQASTTADITKKALVVSGITAGNKVYDGNTSATLDDSGKVYTGLIAGDNFQMTPFTGSFGTKSAGDDKTVTITSYNVGGTDYSNYDVTLQLTALANITQKAITVSGVTAGNKIYDGTTLATLDNSGLTFNGIVSGDDLSASGITGLFSDKNVASGKTVTLSGATYGGTDVGNYSFADQASTTADTTAKAITISGITADDKVYDRLRTATVELSGVTFNGIVSGDDLSASDTTGTFGNKNVGSNKTVTLSGTTYGGTDVGNYSFTDQSSATADIAKKTLVVSGITAGNKVYDGNTSATLDDSGKVYTGLIAGDNFQMTPFSGSFDSKNVGDNKTVTITSYNVGGTDYSNYDVTLQLTALANITQKAITVSGVTAGNKIYDGTTLATLDNSGLTFNGIVSGDDLSATGITGLFSDKNVASGKTVTLSGATYGGTDVGNYSFTDQASTTAGITPKAIAISGITAADMVYDGLTTATVDLSGVTFSGIVSGDDLTASGTTGIFADKNVGSNKTVTLSGTTYGGTDVGNYSFTHQTSDTANITQKSISVSGITAGNKVYDGATTATIDLSGIAYSGIVSGDDLLVSGTAGLFSNKNVGDGKTVTLSGTAYAGTDVGNYSFTDQTSTTADITPKAIAVSGLLANNRIYDGTTDATVDHSSVNFGGIVSGDDLSASGAIGSFADKNVGSSKTVTLSGTTYGGTDLSNYSFTDQTNSTANITPKSITVSGLAANDRIYDGTTSATIEHSVVTLSGIVSGDDLTASGTTGTFADKNVGDAKTVMLSGTTYGGIDVGNYSFTDQTTDTANITPKSITISGLVANDRIYDGSTNATVDHSGVTFGGIVVGDGVTVGSTTGQFADKNVSSGKTVTLSGTVYGGIDVNNYDITDQTTSAASVTPKSISISGLSAEDRIYDGTTAATVDYSGVTFNGIVAGDSLTASDTIGTFADKNVDTGKAVTFSGTVYGGIDVGNYIITDQTTDTANITPKSITISGLVANDRIYDGTTSGAVDLSGITFGGIVAGDDLTASSTVGTFADKNVGNGKAAALSGTTYSGSDVGNYLFTDQAASTADITPKSIIVSGLVANDRIYDGSADATIDHSGVAFSGIVSGDDLTASGTTGMFADRNVGNGKVVTLSGTTYSGIDVGNYDFTDQTLSQADITAKQVTIGAPSVTKVYDGSANFVPSTGQLQMKTNSLGVTGDEVTGLSLTYDDKNVNTNKTLIPSSIRIADGNGGANYDISFAASFDNVITRLSSVIWIGGTTGDWHDPANWAGGAVPDLANVANVTIPDGVTPTFGSNVPGPVQLDTFTGGGLQVDGGTLEVADTLSTETLTQNDGTVNAGTMTSGEFSQTGGTLNADEVSVTEFTQTNGDVNVLNDLTVTNSFTQIEGSITVGSQIDIDHTAGQLGIHDVTGGNVSLDSTSGVHFGTLDVNGDLHVNTDGDIGQDATGSVSAAGDTSFTSPGTISLEASNNEFNGSVQVDAPVFSIESTTPYTAVETGLARADEIEIRVTAETVEDTIVRPSKPYLSTWFNRIVDLVSGLAGNTRVDAQSSSLGAHEIHTNGGQIYIRPRAEDDEREPAGS